MFDLIIQGNKYLHQVPTEQNDKCFPVSKYFHYFEVKLCHEFTVKATSGNKIMYFFFKLM